ncbi:MAG: hypothetical protein LBS36_10425 [Oscillospiraceae bacterium]|jgi:hypothetical protein|nr:hypothetical protein [Oscillospiraceae bacterium]
MKPKPYIEYIDAIGLIAWGYIFLHVNINLGTLNIIPNWAGYLLIYRALGAVGAYKPSALLLRPLGILLGLYELAAWGMALLGGTIDLFWINLFTSVIALYFHFQLLTDLAVIAEHHGCTQAKKIRTLRTALTLLGTLAAIITFYPDFAHSQAISIGIAIVYLVAVLWICAVLFGYRREEQDLAITDEMNADNSDTLSFQ